MQCMGAGPTLLDWISSLVSKFVSLLKQTTLTLDSFALAMVNVAGSRLVLNLKGFKASRVSVEFVDASFSIVSSEAALTPSPVKSAPRQRYLHSRDAVELDVQYAEDLDLEMYSIERDSQQLGTKLLHESFSSGHL